MKDVKEEEDDDDVIGVGIGRGMLDHSRMALCMFMFAVVAFNPFGMVLKRYTDPISDYSATVLDGRTLQHVESGTKDLYFCTVHVVTFTLFKTNSCTSFKHTFTFTF
jgi:hypothetical protein